MKKVVLVGLTVASATFLGGCAQINEITKPLAFESGVQISTEQMEAFEDNKTTKSDVIAAVGQPMEKSMLGSTEVWKYKYTFIPPLPGQKNINEASVFEFNESNVLTSHYKTASESQDALTQAAMGN